MRNLPVAGFDISEITPAAGVLHVAGFIRTPRDKIRIMWEVDGYSGSTECEAWEGQHEIEGLVRGGYTIKSVALC